MERLRDPTEQIGRRRHCTPDCANDHAQAHFHAYYDEYEVTITIRDGVVTGSFPGRALRLVLEWRDLHQSELMASWDRLVARQAPQPIAPLA